MDAIDLTQDDDFIEIKLSAAHRQAAADSREASRAKRRVRDLADLKSGLKQAVEILSDEECNVKYPSIAHRNQTPRNPSRRPAPNRAQPTPTARSEGLGPGHISRALTESRSTPKNISKPVLIGQKPAREQPMLITASTQNGIEQRTGSGPRCTTSSRSPPTMDKSGSKVTHSRNKDEIELPSPTPGLSSHMIEPPRHGRSPKRDQNTKSSANDKNIRDKSENFHRRAPGVPPLGLSPVPKVSAKMRKHHRSSTNDQSYMQFPEGSTLKSSGPSTARPDAEQIPLSATALLSASIADTDQPTREPETVPLEVKDISYILEKHRKALHKYQEGLVKSRLQNAREQYRVFTGPGKPALSVSPFKGLFQSHAAKPMPLTKEEQQNLSIRTSRITPSAVKKSTSVSLPVSTFSSIVERVPAVKSIGRLGVSHAVLGKNKRIVKFIPWFVENEAIPDAKQEKARYADFRRIHDDKLEMLAMQNGCRAISDVWRSQVVLLFAELGIEVEDVIYYLLHDDENEQPTAGTLSLEMNAVWNERTEHCESCQTGYDEDCRGPERRKIIPLIKRPPTERRLAMAGLICAVFVEKERFNLWHVVAEMRLTKGILRHLDQRSEEKKPSTSILRTFCYACCEFKCLTHGAYIENDLASNDDSINNAKHPEAGTLDDPELGINSRVYAAQPVRQLGTRKHRCGVYCVEVSVPEILGSHFDGTVTGAYRPELQDSDPPTFDDQQLCPSKVCFWETSRRKQVDFEKLSRKAEPVNSLFGDKNRAELFQQSLPMDLTSRRGPCELALAFPDITCLEIFYLILCAYRVPAHSETTNATDIESMVSRDDVDLSNDTTFQLRKSFTPCSHVGPCQPGACSCVDEKVSCEPACACSDRCARRFKGCTCREQRRKICFEDNRCACFASNRECYPELCAGCGVQEVLDPVNKGKQDLGLGLRCMNNRIQLGVPKRTIMGASEVQGWGLYAGEDIAKSDFISEYKGELISIGEADRRGTVYHNIGREYLFRLSKDQELDSSRFGTKTRFVNNSSLAKNINVLSKQMLCNGVIRIALFADRDINAGEELFYDYCYPEEKRANFKEKPDSTPRPMLMNARSRSRVASSVVSNTSRSVRSEPALHVTEGCSDIIPDHQATGTSSLESEVLEYKGSDSVPAPNSIQGLPGLRRPASRGNSTTRTRPRNADVFASPPHSPDRATRLRLKQPKKAPSRDRDSDSDTPLRRHISSETQQLPEKAASTRVEDSARRRKINPGDKRLGGTIQRAAAETRRKKLAEQEALLSDANLDIPNRKRKRTDKGASPPAQEPSSSQPTARIKLNLKRPAQLASRTPSPEPAPRTKQLPDIAANLDQEEQEMPSLSQSNSSAAPPKLPVRSEFRSEATRSMPRSSLKSRLAKSAARMQEANKKHLLGYAPR